MPLTSRSSIIDDRMVQTVQDWSDSALPDECVITRPGPVGALDNGRYGPTVTKTVYDGGCRLQAVPITSERAAEHGDEQLTQARYVAAIPADAELPAVRDTLTITSSADPGLVGRSFVVGDIRFDTFTSRRLLILTDRQTRASAP